MTGYPPPLPVDPTAGTHQLLVAVDVDTGRLGDPDYFVQVVNQVRDLADEQLDEVCAASAGPAPRTRWLDAGPLVDAIDMRIRRGGEGVRGVFRDIADERAYFRMRAQGRVSEPVADRLATRLGMQLELLYPTTEAAA